MKNPSINVIVANMSDQGREIPDGGGPDEFGFSWREEEDLPREVEDLVEKLSVPVSQTMPRHIGEIVHSGLAVDFQKRLDALGVEDPRSATKWKIRRLPELFMTAYALDDVHYAVYEHRRAKTPSPFISITFKEIIDEAVVNVVLLQRHQTLQAYFHLVEVGLNPDKLYKMATGNGPEEKFLVRSLSRLLKEDCMSAFAQKLPPQALLRSDEKPFEFAEIAARAAKKIGYLHHEHMALDIRAYSTDERMWHFLTARNLERARAIAEPLMNFIQDSNKDS